MIHVWLIRKAPFFTVLMGDARAYDAWALQIAHGDWLGRDVFYQAPLYPYFLGTLYAIAGRNLLAVRICQAIVGSLACVLLGLAGVRLFSKSVGLVAGLALALYAPAIFFDSLIQKSVLDVFFICLTLWLVGCLIGRDELAGEAHDAVARRLQPSDPPRRWYWLWLGLAMGGLSLTRENALVLIVVILAWAFARNRVATRERVATAGTFLLGLAIVLFPVALRNRVVGGEFHLTTSQFGPNFYIGNNARADGTYMSLRFGRGAPEHERQDATELAEHAVGRPLTPAEVSGYWTGQALAFITSHPEAWLTLVGKKIVLVWNATEMLDTESQESYADWSLPLRLAGRVGHFGVLVPLALVGVIVTWPHRARLWVLYAMLAAYAASVVMFYVFARYRFPLVPFLVLFAAAGLVDAPRFVCARAIRPSIAAAAAVIAVAIFANRPVLSADLMRAITENNLGVALQAEERTDEATDHYRRAIGFAPDYAPAYNNMGVALRSKGRLDEAVATYERALALAPDYVDLHYNLANALLEKGRPDEAVDHFRRALQATPGSVDVHNNLGIALDAEGKPDEAIAEFRDALRLDPASSQTRRNLGNALYNHASARLEDGHVTDAIDQFRAALELLPDSVEAHNNLGIALASLGRLDEAIDEFQQAVRLQPAFADARRNLTMALQARQKIGRTRNGRP